VFPRINIINVIQQSVLDEGAITLGRILSHFLNRSRHRSAAGADPRPASGSIAGSFRVTSLVEQGRPPFEGQNGYRAVRFFDSPIKTTRALLNAEALSGRFSRLRG